MTPTLVCVQIATRTTLVNGLTLFGFAFLCATLSSGAACGQESETTAGSHAAEKRSSGEAKQDAKEERKEGPEEEMEGPEPRTDFTVMFGSDFVRPGSLPRANLSVGMGHVFECLRRDPLGDGITFGYAYENTGAHGFFHSAFGEHSELLGLMRDFPIGRARKVDAYNWLQGGLSSLTGDVHVHNRFSGSESVGLKIHLTRSSAIWVDESYNKVATLPWYTITSVGYTYSR